jgi:Family of unknown function (DUF6459)
VDSTPSEDSIDHAQPRSRPRDRSEWQIEAGLRSASQLERTCHPSLWDAVANRIQRAGGPPVSGSSVLRIQVQELSPGLVDDVAIVRRGQRAVFIARRLEAVPGRWELIQLLY